jgi:phospholipase/lecithinase/hemolysin
MDKFMVRLARLLCLVFAALMVSSAMAGQANYQAIYVFGDSLSDTGNDFAATTAQGMVPAIPPSVSPYKTYYKGRFSNGPVAVEYLWRLLARKNSAELTPYIVDPRLDKKASVNFAFGGAGSGEANLTPNGFMVPGLLGQVGLYNTALAGKKSNSNALYVVWSGANDYLQNLEYDPYKIVGNVETAVRALYATGARDFLVPNLPDLGNTPLIKAQGAGAAATFTGFAKAHNALLSARLTALAKALPGSRIVKLDVFALGETLVNTGLINDDVPAIKFLSPNSGAEQCLFVNPAACVDVDDLGFLAPFLYWDVLHPTTQVHGVIGTAMYVALLKQK